MVLCGYCHDPCRELADCGVVTDKALRGVDVEAGIWTFDSEICGAVKPGCRGKRTEVGAC